MSRDAALVIHMSADVAAAATDVRAVKAAVDALAEEMRDG